MMTAELFATLERHDLDRLVALLSDRVHPNVEQPDWPGWTALHVAIDQLDEGGPIEALIHLLRHGAAVDGWDSAHDSTPLLMALFREQPEAVRLLLAAGADPNAVSSEGTSPLRWCAERDDRDTAAMLLRCGATKTINEPGAPTGASALGLAAIRLNIPMIELLLAAGADPNALDADYRTASERMPPRDASNAPTWDAAAALLGPRRP